MEKRALQLASVASMIDLFNTDNTNILLSLGYKVDVATNFEEGSITSQERVNEYREELNKQGIDTFQIPIPRSIKKTSKIIKSYKLVKELVESRKYQIVHCHSPIGGVICRLACRKARKKYGTKVIYTAHGFHFFKGSSKTSWIIYYPVEKFCSKYTDILITINNEDYDLATRKFKSKQVVYVPGIGVHTEEIKNLVVNKDAIRSQFGFSHNDFVFMSTGQISIRKNHEVIIRALAKINDNHVKYLIVGFGEEEERLKKLVCSLGLQNRVVFAGYRNDVFRLLHSVDAFAFPSIHEGLPVALMEAMAAGLPIVCSKIRGIVDLIEDGHGGFLCDPYNVDEFVISMKKIISSDRHKYGEINIIKVSNFDFKIVNEKMHKLYIDVISN